MNLQRLGWLGMGSLLIALTGCEIKKCDKDAGECNFDWDDRDGSTDEESDASSNGDGDGGTLDGGDIDGGDGDGDGDGGGAEDASTGEPITLAEFCEAQFATAVAWRDFMELDCFCPNDTIADREAFLATVLAYPDNAVGLCEDRYGALESEGKLTFVGTKAQACAKAFADQFAAPPSSCPQEGFNLWKLEADMGHGVSVLAQIPVCREALVGKVGADEACNDSIECAGSLRCRSAPGGGKTCQSPVPTNGTCTNNGECADGHTCVGSNAGGGRACRRNDDLAINGGNCSFSKECVAGLVCDELKCVAPTISNDDNICEQL